MGKKLGNCFQHIVGLGRNECRQRHWWWQQKGQTGEVIGTYEEETVEKGAGGSRGAQELFPVRTLLAKVMWGCLLFASGSAVITIHPNCPT